MSKVATLFTVLVASLFAAPIAHAEIFNACGVKETKDGFVALRDKPSSTARLVTRMKAGEVLVIDKNRKGDGLVKAANGSALRTITARPCRTRATPASRT